MPLLRTRQLTKHYGQAFALTDLDLTIEPGEIVGLLGPNGAGKSTALRLMLGFLQPTRGSAEVAGFDCWRQSLEVRRRVTYLPGELRLYDRLTGRELLRFLANLRGDSVGEQAEQLARQFDIDLNTPMTRMSSGMKRKVALIAVLSPNVPFIILDEPTNTLDPTMRDLLLEHLRLARQAGKAVLFSSHVLQEVEATCDRVVMLRKGRLVHEQCMAELRKGRHIIATLNGPLTELPPEGSTIVEGRGLDLNYRGPLPALLDWLARQPLNELRMEPMGLGPIYRHFHGASA